MANPFPPGSKLACYLRDSGGDDQDLSIEQQENAVRDWAQENKYQVALIFKDEARPGSSTIGREGFQAMMSHFRTPGVPEVGILVWKYSRFARDIDDAQFYRADLRRRGYEFYSLNDSIPPGPDGRFFEAAIDWMNARFLLDLSTDVKRGLNHIVEQYGAIPGTPPRGFKREPFKVGKRRDGSDHILHRWVPDPDLVDKVRTAFEMRAAGATYRQIQERTRLYKSKNCWPTFFRNRLYIGILEFGDLVIEDYCEPIVSVETFNQVQALHRPHTKPKPVTTYLLSGLLECARCGSAMNGHVIKSSDGKTYEYYVCNRRKRRHDCDASYIPRRVFEAKIKAQLRDQIFSPENLREVQEELRRRQSDKDAARNEMLADLKQDLASARLSIANITDAIAEYGHSKALLEKLHKFEQEEAGLQARLKQLDSPTVLDVDIDDLSAGLRRALDQATDEQLKYLLSSLVGKIVAERNANQIQGVIYYHILEPGSSYAPSKCPHGLDAWRHKEFEYSLAKS